MMPARKVAFAVLLALFAVAYVLSRAALIDSDLVPFDVTQYQPIDAFYYAMMAFDWYRGNVEPAALVGYAPLPSSLLLNALVYPNLVLLGNTFAGMRANVVLISLLVSVTFAVLFYCRFGFTAAILSLATFLVSMSWVMASLVVEPTMYRLFHLALLLLAWQWLHARGWLHTRGGIILISVLAYAGPLFVYPTNFFALPSVLLLYALDAVRLRDWGLLGRVILWNLVSGAAVGAAWLLAIQLSVGGLEPVINYFFMFDERVAGGTDTPMLEQAWTNFQSIEHFLFFAQVPFAYQAFCGALPVAIVFLISSGVFALQGRNTDDTWRFDTAMVVLLLMFTGQTLFVNDYPVRKLVFLLPFCLFLVPFVVHRLLRLRPARTAVVLAATMWIAVHSLALTREHLAERYTETMKTAMLSLQELGEVPVGGGFSHGFRLYNDIQPFLSYYTYAYVLQDLPTYYAAMANRIVGVDVRYSIQIEVTDQIVEHMAELGFIVDRVLIDGTERGVGRVVLFRRPSRAGQ